jgi:hypothetical protein
MTSDRWDEMEGGPVSPEVLQRVMEWPDEELPGPCEDDAPEGATPSWTLVRRGRPVILFDFRKP